MRYFLAFEGTINGKRAVAVVNDTSLEKTWTLEELGMPENCIDLLDDKKVFNSITLQGVNAVLLIAE